MHVMQLGPYRFDPASGELWAASSEHRPGTRAGARTGTQPVARLRPQAAQVLSLLLERPGRLVSRREIQDAVWPDTEVELDQGLNACIREIRTALGDRADEPTFVETVPRRGYRWIAPVEDRAPGGSRHGARLGLAAAVGALVFVALAADLGRDRPAAPLTGVEPRRPTGQAARSTLVVLPLENLGGDPEQDYLAEGLTEELITELARIHPERLGVIARTSALHYRGSSKTVAEIAGELDADYVLEGSVRPGVDRVRITAQLLRPDDQTHLWAQSWDRPWNDVLAIQRDIARRVADALSMQLLEPFDSPEVPAAPAVRDRLLRARYLLERTYARKAEEEAGIARARELLEEARSLDPAHAPVTVELARARWRQGAPEDALKLVETVLERDPGRHPARQPGRAEAHLLRAMLALFEELDWETSRRHFETAARLAPGSAEVHQTYAFYFTFTGRHERAIEEVERALRLDPVSPNVRADVGWVYFYARRWQDAARQCRAMLELTPENRSAERCVMLAHLQAGDLEAARGRAVALLEKAEAPEDTIRQLVTAPGDTWLPTYWRWRLERVATRTEMPESWRRVETARALLGLDRRDEALASLERAFGSEACAAVLSVGVDPRFDPLRREPRFRSLLAELAGQPTSAPALASSASTPLLLRIPVSK